MSKNRIYKNWENNSKELQFVYRNAFSGFETPNTTFKKGYKKTECSDFQIKSCKAYCCSGVSNVIELSPTEITIISNKTQKSPSEFVGYGEIQFLFSGTGPTTVWPTNLNKNKKLFQHLK